MLHSWTPSLGMGLESILCGAIALIATAWLWDFFAIYLRPQRKLGPPLLGYRVPFGLDMLREAKKFKKMHRFYQLIEDNGAKLKSTTYEVRMPATTLYVTVEPENIKAILATQFKDFGKGQLLHDRWEQFLGDGIFNSDGEIWYSTRALLRPQFLKQRISDLHIFEFHTNRLLSLIPKNGETFDIMDLWYRFTLDAATEFLFGQSVDSLDNPKVAFSEAFSILQANQVTRSTYGAFWRLYYNPKLASALNTLNNFIAPFVQMALSRQSHDSGNFTDALSEFTQNPKVLRDQLVNILLAGRDTTAATLSFLFLELAYHPEVYKRLREEVLQNLGFDGEPTYANLKAMKYLQNCLNETLRLYPIVPVNSRTALVNTTLPRGGGPQHNDPIFVPKGTMCLYSPYVMQRREDLFGPTVNEFNPSRWETWIPVPWTYIPFNGGPRICLGQNFALTEMAYTVARICQLYERIEERSGKARAEQRFCEDVILSPLEGVKIGLVRANKGG